MTVARSNVEPGDEAQIDYGYLGTFLDPVRQKLRKVWAFVIVPSRLVVDSLKTGVFKPDIYDLHLATRLPAPRLSEFPEVAFVSPPSRWSRTIQPG